MNHTPVLTHRPHIVPPGAEHVLKELGRPIDAYPRISVPVRRLTLPPDAPHVVAPASPTSGPRGALTQLVTPPLDPVRVQDRSLATDDPEVVGANAPDTAQDDRRDART